MQLGEVNWLRGGPLCVLVVEGEGGKAYLVNHRNFFPPLHVEDCSTVCFPSLSWIFHDIVFVYNCYMKA